MNKERRRQTKEIVENFLNHVDMKAFNATIALIDQIIESMERDILNFDLNNASWSSLGLKKAKLDGANLLKSRLINDTGKFRKQSE